MTVSTWAAAAPQQGGLLLPILTVAALAMGLVGLDASLEAARAQPGGANFARLTAIPADPLAAEPRDEGPSAPHSFVRPMPEGPTASIALIVEPRDSAELKRAFADTRFKLEAVRGGAAEVPRLYVAALPGDIAELAPVETRKEVFLRTVLPLVLLANEELRQRRARLLDLADRIGAGETLPIADKAWLDALADHYAAEHGDLETLKRRVDAIPVSLALAQAIVESGWGTSRFAQEGNALFGQRTWSAHDGIRARRAGVHVAAFPDLMESVRSYMHNLNTHRAYSGLRAERAARAAEGTVATGDDLVHALEDYAEIDGYVAKLRTLMRHNALAELDGARLRSRTLQARMPGR